MTTVERAQIQIARAMLRLPDVGRYGFRDVGTPDRFFAMLRAAMLKPEGIAEFLRARTWLRNFSMEEAINPGITTAELVRQARIETKWNYSDGMMIAAAWSLGFDVARASDSAHLNIGKRIERRFIPMNHPAITWTKCA